MAYPLISCYVVASYFPRQISVKPEICTTNVHGSQQIQGPGYKAAFKEGTFWISLWSPWPQAAAKVTLKNSHMQHTEPGFTILILISRQEMNVIRIRLIVSWFLSQSELEVLTRKPACFIITGKPVGYMNCVNTNWKSHNVVGYWDHCRHYLWYHDIIMI